MAVGTGVSVGGSGVLVAGTTVALLVADGTSVGDTVNVRVFDGVNVADGVTVLDGVSVGVIVAVNVADAVLVGMIVAVAGTAVGGTAVSVAGTGLVVRVARGRLVATTAVSVGMMMTNTGVWVAASDGVASGVVLADTVATLLACGVVGRLAPGAKVVLMSNKNVTIRPIPIGRMKLSGMPCIRASGRYGILLRASSMLRRRGWVEPLVPVGVVVGLVAAPSSDSMNWVTLGDVPLGVARPAIWLLASVVLGS